jgi:hypothetical protein
MKASWLHGLILVLLVALSPLKAEAMDAAMPTSDNSMLSLCDSATASEPCCECCVDCDDLAMLGACSLLCVSHSGLAVSSVSTVAPAVGSSLLTGANCWACRVIPPDPHPPKAAAII